jgi:hypothetical protein
MTIEPNQIRNEVERGELSLSTSKWLSDTKVVYVASPYTKGDVAQNVRTQVLAAETLRHLGYLPIIPLLSHFWHFASPHPYEYWLMMDAQKVYLADAILRLPGESDGADFETELARLLGKPVFYSVQDLIRELPVNGGDECP